MRHVRHEDEEYPVIGSTYTIMMPKFIVGYLSMSDFGRISLIVCVNELLTGLVVRSHICNHSNDKPPCELAISHDIEN